MTAKKSTKKSTAGDAAANSDAAAAQVNAAPTPVTESGGAAESGKPAKDARPKKKGRAGKGAEVAVKAPAASRKQSPAGKSGKAPAQAPAKPKAGKTPEKPKPAAKAPKTGKTSKTTKAPGQETAKILDSQLAFEGPLFRVMRDHIIEPGGRESHRDVIRHNGSVVILAVDPGKKKKDPWVVVERQYRHAAGQFLWELPAGKLDAGESGLDGAKRELAEETGYQAKKWSTLIEYFASPGFLGESMKIFLAEGLVAGEAHPEEDEHIDFRLVKFSELLNMVDKGKIIDGKTLTGVLLYARQLGIKRKH
jgi:ADP-ribose pyrophosphatase